MPKITIQPDGHGHTQMLVDGHDISRAVKRDGVSIEFVDGSPHVTLKMVEMSVILDLDLPDAALTALVGEPA